MSHVVHHSILVTGYNRQLTDDAYEAALRNDLSVTVPKMSAVNSYWTFAVLPDGSKEGWQESDVGDENRTRFKKYLRTSARYFSWVEVAYGDTGTFVTEFDDDGLIEEDEDSKSTSD